MTRWDQIDSRFQPRRGGDTVCLEADLNHQVATSAATSNRSRMGWAFVRVRVFGEDTSKPNHRAVDRTAMYEDRWFSYQCLSPVTHESNGSCLRRRDRGVTAPRGNAHLVPVQDTVATTIRDQVSPR